MPLSPKPVNVTYVPKGTLKGFCLLSCFFFLFLLFWFGFLFVLFLAAPHITQDLVQGLNLPLHYRDMKS